MTTLRSIARVAAVLIALTTSAPVRAADVDLALVLAIDVSSSINEEQYQLQMRGYVEAFRDPTVIDAIKNGTNGAIAVTLVQWAGYNEYRQAIDWAVIADTETAGRFASAIAESRRAQGGSTSVSGAIDFSAQILRSNGHNASRMVIDISGDGSNNNGRPAAMARDEAVASGIIINGLPILTEEPTLDAYYREHVVGGPGAFVLVAENFESFSAAILRKLVLEIAGNDGALYTVCARRHLGS